MSELDPVSALIEAAGVDPDSLSSPNWEQVERSLDGLVLPDDYKRLVGAFPHGRFKEFVTVVRPGILDGSPGEYLGYYAYTLDDMKRYREGGYGTFPHPIFPEQGGVLPWGDTNGAGMFFWLTDGDDPNAWPTVWADGDYAEWFRYDATMSQLLLRIVQEPPAEMVRAALHDLASAPVFRSFESSESSGSDVEADAGQIIGFEPFLSGGHGRLPTDESDALLEAIPAGKGSPQDWRTVEEHLGQLPPDYKRFYDAVGPGVFCDIRIFDVQPAPASELVVALQKLRQAIFSSGAQIFVTLHPEFGGLVPWGATPDGWTFCWKPVGSDPAHWGVAVIGPQFVVIELPELSFTTFLLQYSGVRDANLFLYDREPWSGPLTFEPR
jgi:hypothetical protein